MAVLAVRGISGGDAACIVESARAVLPVKKHRTHQPKQTAVTNVAIIEALEATNNC